MLNGTDWPSPAATLMEVESDIKEVLASAGVHVNISPQPRMLSIYLLCRWLCSVCYIQTTLFQFFHL
jgi:hypothetical protein